LDAVLDGRLVRATLTLVAGSLGTGKTTLVLSFADALHALMIGRPECLRVVPVGGRVGQEETPPSEAAR
jgi:predicted ATP-dependent serine protease